MMGSRYFVGLGANIGHPRQTLLAALAAIEADGRTHIRARSSLYRSAPLEADGPDFLNAVIELDSELSPIELLAFLQSVERAAGRERPYRNAPRTLDLDLLLAGGQIIDTADLSVPHPRMHRRAFVLAPLIEISPDIAIPGRGHAAALLAECADQSIERIGPFGPLDADDNPVDRTGVATGRRHA